MTTTTKRPPRAPACGTCCWLLQPIGQRPGMLTINDATYLFEVLRHAGRPYGFRLTRQGAGPSPDAEYQLAPDLSDCDCPDATFAADRPGGCKHRRALAVALAALSTDAAQGELSY